MKYFTVYEKNTEENSISEGREKPFKQNDALTKNQLI